MSQPPRPVTFVLPGDVDDPVAASGGNRYGLRMCDYLGATKVAIDGCWPSAGAEGRAALADALAALPDGRLVVIDGLLACGTPEVIGPAAARLRVCVVVHLPLAEQAGLDPAVATALDARERTTLHAVGAVVATSPWAARHLVDRHDLDPHRVHVAAPGTDPAPLATGTDGRSRLLCVAAVTPHKGQDLLVEALALLAGPDGPAGHWTAVCVGPLRRDPAFVERVRRLIELHGLADRIVLAGPQAEDELAASYAAADLLVLPSQGETYGMVVAEALVRGIPVLTTATGALPETLGRTASGIPGILVPERNAMTLAAALRRWLTEPELRARLRVSARDRRETVPGWAGAAGELSGVLDRMAAA